MTTRRLPTDPSGSVFRALKLRHRRFRRRTSPIDGIETLAEGIKTPHPAMPEFELDQRQIGDLIAYLKSLER
jgi:cytochrome c